jgi:PAS domain-containing protein
MKRSPKKPSPTSSPEHAARHLAALVESSDDAIASKTLDGIVITWNPAAERLFGYSAEEMAGQIHLSTTGSRTTPCAFAGGHRHLWRA